MCKNCYLTKWDTWTPGLQLQLSGNTRVSCPLQSWYCTLHLRVIKHTSALGSYMRQSRVQVLALDSSYFNFFACSLTWSWPISSHSEKAGHNVTMCMRTSVIYISCPQSLKNAQGPRCLLKWHSKNVSKNSVLNRNILFSVWVMCLRWHVLLLNGQKDEECKWLTLYTLLCTL